MTATATPRLRPTRRAKAAAAADANTRDTGAVDVVTAGEGMGGGVASDLVDAACVIAPRSLLAGGAGSAVNTFVDNGGVVLQVTQLQLVYWGAAWTSTAPAPSPTAQQVTAACRTMMASAYLTGLAQYRGIGRGFVRGESVITSSNPPQGFRDQDVSNFIDAQLTAGALPAPDVDNETLYCVVMPQGVSASNTSFIGEHTYYTRSGQRIHFAWITNGGSLSGLTRIISHEVVESATDPEGTAFLGVAGTCSQGGWCEIGDVCSSTSQLDGVTVQSYFSNQDAGCVVPSWPARSYPRVGTQFTGSVPASSSRRWFTFNWPEWERVEWRMLPTTARSGGAELRWDVAIERASGNYLTYWITVTNLTPVDVTFEGRYCVLGRN